MVSDKAVRYIRNTLAAGAIGLAGITGYCISALPGYLDNPTLQRGSEIKEELRSLEEKLVECVPPKGEYVSAGCVQMSLRRQGLQKEYASIQVEYDTTFNDFVNVSFGSLMGAILTIALGAGSYSFHLELRGRELLRAFEKRRMKHIESQEDV